MALYHERVGSIGQGLRQMAAERADEMLLWQADGGVSFGEMHARSDAVAASLAGQGIGKGDRVGLYCINGADFVAAYAGIVKLGAVVVPVNLLLNPREVGFILGDAQVRGLIYHAAMSEPVAALRDQLSLDFWCAIGEPQQPDDLLFSDWLASVGTPPEPVIDGAEDLAAIIYTSGTTGSPKGAMLTHRNLLANSDSVRRALDLQAGRDRLLVVLPMFHSFAATVGMLTPLLHGLCIVPVARFDPALVCEAIAAAGATVFLGVPSMYGVLLRIGDEQLAGWRTVRYGVSGGAAMPVALMQQFERRFGIPILEGDGPTECSPVTCVNPLDGERKPASVGLPVPQVEMRIFDDDGGELPNGEIGEICVRGPNTMKGYWHLPEATAETFFDDWLRTGDLGYIDADGYVFIVDRKKDMVIVNGMNVYPRMIEEVLYRHPAVAEAAVVGENHPSHGEIVVAHLVLKPGVVASESDIRQWCRDELGVHQRPRRIVLREALPKNATGKILKRELRQSGELERGVDAGDR